MQLSPLRSLVSRHLCNCRPSVQLNKAVTRSISISSRQYGNYPSPSSAHVGSPELLKRRYQPTKQDVDREKVEIGQLRKRMKRSAFGIAACSLAIFATVYLYPENKNNVTRLDAPPSIPGFPDTSLKEEVEQVETGTSSVPQFPKTIRLSELDAPNAAVTDQGEQEYQLVGLGIRTVSFLSIQVYVVGLYVAVPDIATLQERLIRTVDPVATTLVPGEKAKLKESLLDPERSEEIWSAIFKEGGIRTVWRISPTRNTGFDHLRDGWVRGITGKTQHFRLDKGDESFSDETFGKSLNDFKATFAAAPRKNLPKGESLLLTRDAKGVLGEWYEDENGSRTRFGQLSDERISRLIWLLYLGGKTVSSASARDNVVNGVMEYVERPVGTVATQVV